MTKDNFELSIVQGHGLVFVVGVILGGDFSIQEEIQGQIPAIEDYTKRWLD